MKNLKITSAGDSRLFLNALTLTLATLTVTSVSLFSHAQSIGAGTPGGVQPSTDRRDLPTATERPVYELPAVPDRPLEDDAGPKIVVARFQLEGVEDIPNSPIKQEVIHRLLEKIRLAQPQGFTIGQLQQTANKVTQHYRQQGYILAQAIVPQQKISNQTVVIHVFNGKLGQLSTANNDYYSTQLMKRPFQQLIDKAVHATDVENALLRLDDTPGLEAFGVFRPGKNIGETELVLNAKKETPLSFIAIADNHGVETTGTNRLIGSLSWNNPTGSGDRLTITALQTFDPDDATYGAFDYHIPVFDPALNIGVSYSTNDYAISQSLGVPNTDGETQIASIYGRYSFIRSRTLNLEARLDFSRKWAEVELQNIDFNFGKDDLSVFSPAVKFDWVDNRLGGGITEGTMSYHHGLADFAGSMGSDGNNNALRQGGSGEYSGGNFQKLAFELTRLQYLTTSNSLLIRLEGQYSNDLLSSIEQYSMGGPNSVRAYPVSEYIRDKALFSSIEWIINAPGFSDKAAFAGRNWGEVFQVSLFVDYAEGKRNDAAPGENEDQELIGAGIGLELKLPNKFFIRAEAATPLSNQDASNGDDPQLWFSAGIEI